MSQPMTTRPRTELQTLLETICPRVYYQPPSNMQLKYPCIIYVRNKIVNNAANNQAYLRRTRYTLTLIDKNPESAYLESLENLNYCSHTRNFVSDNLNHDVFDIYW